MLVEIAEELDAWIVSENIEARAQGLPQLRACRIRLLGQTALLEGGATLHLNLTNDVDVYANYEHAVEVEFRRLLALRGKIVEYLATGVSDRFLTLAKQYKLDLEQFL